MIDDKGAFLYAAQLYSVLAADDPAMVLGNPITRAVLISLCKDLVMRGSLTGSAVESLRRHVDELRIPVEGGEIFLRDDK